MFRPTLFILVCFLTVFSSAQTYEAAVLAGANFSQVDGDQLAGYNKLGLFTGIAISRDWQEPWQWSFEILYTQKGSQKVLDPDIPQPALVINYHYVEVPLLARYKFSDDIIFFAGPSFGVNVFNQRDDNGLITKEDGLLGTEVALHLGGTYMFTDHWGVDLRHSYSLLSVRDFPIVFNGPTWFGRAGWYNRLFTVALRYDLGQ